MYAHEIFPRLPMKPARFAALSLAVFTSLAAPILYKTAQAASLQTAQVASVPEPAATLPAVPQPASSRRSAETAAEGFLGVVLPRASADITAGYEGRIRAVHVRLGDSVPENGLIATLDAPGDPFELAMAQAALTAAEAGLEKANVELSQTEERFARSKALSAQALVSGEDLSAARYQHKLAGVRVQTAKAELMEKRARVEQLRKANSETEIRAPFAGTVAARYADPGAGVMASTPIVRLLGAGELFVRFVVPEDRAATMSTGHAVEVRIGEGKQIASGTIERIAPEIDAASRMVIVEATLDAAAREQAVRSGEVARVSLR